MPAIDANLNILSASANYTAGNWASVGAQGSLDIQIGAAFRRGFDLQIGAEALVKLDASIRKFLAVDAQAFATASAGVRAQLQTPIDLFSEAGAALRLQAQAQAAAGVQLGIGLSVRDFLAIVDNDPRLRGAPARLVRVLLEEATVRGGVLAKAAFAAMAYVNVSATGRLIPAGTVRPGFTVAVEKGAGLGAGGGVKGYVDFGFADPRNLVRRSVDVAVGSTLDDLLERSPDARLTRLLEELRTPARIALRTAFEIGLELAANGGAFSAGAGPALSLRAVQVALEEGQRAILERAVRWAADELRQAIGRLTIGTAAWNATLADRTALVAHLRAIPAEPFEATAANRAYWARVLDLASRLFVALGGLRTPSDPGASALATLYAASQLLFIAVERISSASARASVIGVQPAVAAQAFAGTVAAPADILRRHINAAIGKPAGTAITQEALVTYLVEGRLLATLTASFPELEAISLIVTGEASGAVGAGLSTILSNIGAFVPGPGGGVDPRASLGVLMRGLRSYIEARIQGELVPLLEEVLDDAPPELRTYLDEVLLASLGFVTDEVLGALLDWANGSSAAQQALREACSATLMQLFGRSLVVTADAMLARLMAGMSGAYRDLAGHIGDRGGIADVLMALPHPPTVRRDDVVELLSETFLVLADAARPLEEDRRARIRDLLYRIMDFRSAAPDARLSERLLADLGALNIEAGGALAMEFGALFADRLIGLVKAWLQHAGARALEEIGEVIDAIAAEVRSWVADLEALAGDLARRAQDLLAEIARLAAAMEQRFDQALDSAAALVSAFAATGTARARLRSGLRETVLGRASSVLAGLPGYDLVPGWAKGQVDRALGTAVDALLPDALLDPVLDAMRGPALEAADFLRDLRDIEPGDDLTAAVLDLFLDRIEEAVTGVFGGASPRLPLGIRFKARAVQHTIFGPISLSFDVDLDLGAMRVPLAEVIDAVREAAHSIDAIAAAAEAVATTLAAAISAERALASAQAEHAVVDAAKAETDTALAETRPAALDAIIVSPGEASIAEGSLLLDIHLPGVPRSYLGLQPQEAQRVHVWLNRKLLANDSFAVRGLGDGSKASGARDLAGVAMQRATAAARTAHPILEVRDIVRTSSRPVGMKSTAAKLAGPRLGRTIRESDRRIVEASAASGIGLQRRLTPDQMAEGINTLVVAVVDGRGRYRVERQVTFVALPPQKRPKPPPTIRSGRKVPAPIDPVFSLDALPPSIRERLATAIGRTDLLARPAKAATGAKASFHTAGALGPWMPTPKSQRAKEIVAERARATDTLQAARKPVQQLRAAIVEHRLSGTGTEETK